jgi:hypothetical protein
LSLNDRVAFTVDVELGRNLTLIVQRAPGFTVLPQLLLVTLNTFALDPVIFRLKFMSAPLPLLVRVVDRVLLLPGDTKPKFRLVGFRFTDGEFTFCEVFGEVLPVKLLSPPYWAFRVLEPAVRKVIEQLPLPAPFIVPVQDSFVLAVTVTEPVGPAPIPEAVKLIKTGCCNVDGLGEREVMETELAALVAEVVCDCVAAE